MKNKLRKIVVCGNEYKWSLGNHDCDGDGGMMFKVWIDKNNLLIEELIHSKSFTPKMAAKRIALKLQKLRIEKHEDEIGLTALREEIYKTIIKNRQLYER